jgi:hypothetical protein
MSFGAMLIRATLDADHGSVAVRDSAPERMNSPLERHEVRLRGLHRRHPAWGQALGRVAA